MDTNEFLTQEELKILTGYSSPSKQIKHLRQIGLPFYTNGRGRPVVVRDVIKGNIKHKQKDKAQRWQPSIN